MKLVVIDRFGRELATVRVGQPNGLNAAVHAGPGEEAEAAEAYGLEDLERWADDGGR